MKQIQHILFPSSSHSCSERPSLRWVLIFLLMGRVLPSIAGNIDGPLAIDVISSKNFTVETGTGTGPNVVYIGARICNNGTEDLSDVTVHLGDFSSGAPAVFPARTHLGLSGSFSLSYEGNAQDASRNVGRLAAGTCVVQYWLVSYPTQDANGKAVTQTSLLSDDLWLNYDLWATADEEGTQLAVDLREKCTLRGQSAASASRIWKASENKIPIDYESIATTVAASENLPAQAAPGAVIGTSGIWHELGKIKEGMDQDGDMVPDYSLVLQPVGKSSRFDPNCFRLVRMYGTLIVEKDNGTQQWIPFENQVLFSDIPTNNTQVFALVYYDFMVLNGPCAGRVSPYQASSVSPLTEKYNIDFGRDMDALTAQVSQVSLTLSHGKVVPAGAKFDYQISLTNAGTTSVGRPDLAAPLVIEQTIPAGFALKDSIEVQLPMGMRSQTLYSSDNGQSWTPTQPVSGLTHIQWRMDQPLAASDSLIVVLSGETTQALAFETRLRLGQASPFLKKATTVVLGGNFSLAGTLFMDNGTAAGSLGNGVLDQDESPLSGKEIHLFADQNKLGTWDKNDPLIAQFTTNAWGEYKFEGLAPGAYWVVLAEASVPAGHISQASRNTQAITIQSTSLAGLDFALIPLVSGEIRPDANGFDFNEGEKIPFQLDLTNHAPVAQLDSASIARLVFQVQYDPTTLQYQSASLSPVEVDATNGLLTWQLSSLRSAEHKNIGLTFLARELNGKISEAQSVSLSVVSGMTAAGDAVNTSQDIVTVTIAAKTTLSGYVWHEGLTGTMGWTGATGYDNQDIHLENIKLRLYGCVSSTGELVTASDPGNLAKKCTHSGLDGSWQLLDTLLTTTNGYYEFNGLEEGFYYMDFDPTSLPTVAYTLKADPNEKSGLCSTCDGRWNAPDNKLSTFTQVDGLNDLTNISFGLQLDNMITGRVWEDVNGNGEQESQEPGLVNVEVQLTSGDCQAVQNCPTAITDSLGNYQFSNLSNGTAYTVQLIASSLNSAYTWNLSAEADGTPDYTLEINLQPNEIAASQDFGLHAQGSAEIGDKVYLDWNGNLQQDVEDEGIPNISVYLYRDIDENTQLDLEVDVFVQTEVTSNNGEYLFSGLPQGAYIVKVEEADPDFPLYAAQLSDPEEAGRICLSCGGSGSGSGVNENSSLSFPFRPNGQGKVASTVWLDLNGDGEQSGTDEIGLANITVTLSVDMNHDGNYVLLETTETDADGQYTFTGLSAGTYQVEIDQLDSDFPTTESGGAYLLLGPDSYTAQVSQFSTDLVGVCTDCATAARFGFAEPASIGDIVYWDYEGDGTMDEGIPGVVVCLCEGTTIPCNTSNALSIQVTSYGTTEMPMGAYQFTNLAPGQYTVAVISSTAPIYGASATMEPDGEGAPCGGGVNCDGHYSFELGAGTALQGLDFGYQAQRIAGGQVWLDMDGDGLRDAGELGKSDVTVAIIPPRRVNVGAGPGRAVLKKTDEEGRFSFTNLPDGMYFFSIQVPPGYALTSDGDLSLDGMTTLYMIGGKVAALANVFCTDCNMAAGMGLRYGGVSTLSGTVCMDDPTEDGVCNTGIGDIKRENQPVYLYDALGTQVGAVQTGPAGDFSFPNLPAGAYTISIATSTLPLNLATLTTTTASSPANQININAASVSQEILLTGSQTGLDFAFRMPDRVDFGDLPLNFSNRSGIAYHLGENPTTNFLGATVDWEDYTAASSDAFGDDQDGDDEDGVTFLSPENWEVGPVSEGKGGMVEVVVVGEGWLIGWVDFNRDEDFLDDGEMLLNQAVGPGVHTLSFDIPEGTQLDGEMFSRFRLSNEEPMVPALAFVGGAEGGEVEDTRFSFTSLPVELLAFTALPGKQQVVLQWATGAEYNAAYFGVERSIDGTFYQKIGEVEAKGGAFNTYDYTHLDQEAVELGISDIYYRLRMVDHDGAFQYSNIEWVSLEVIERQTLLVMPVTETGLLQAQFTAVGAKSVQLRLLSTLGQELINETREVSMGINHWQKDISHLSPGIYFLQLRDGDKFSVIRFIKP